MYRKIMGFLEAWKENKHRKPLINEHRKPLILQGARQVGKTYSILEFGRTHYENVAYFNFETNPKLNETFEENISPDYLIPILSHIAGQTIVKEKTLIVFDEVQLCERALTSLKYFCEDAPDYHIIVAGSLLGVAVNRAFDLAQILLRERSRLPHHCRRQLARRCGQQSKILFPRRKGRYENALSYGYGGIYVGAR
ncbi:aTPase [Ruminococcus sp. CAG:108]|nr:AAA family ATPase [Ruminococcus sp. CAG:108]CCX83661.1 aTPase [Ruminococcus sp. CAG:108]